MASSRSIMNRSHERSLWRRSGKYFLYKHGLVSKLLKNKYVELLKNCVKKSKAIYQVPKESPGGGSCRQLWGSLSSRLQRDGPGKVLPRPPPACGPPQAGAPYSTAPSRVKARYWARSPMARPKTAAASRDHHWRRQVTLCVVVQR